MCIFNNLTWQKNHKLRSEIYIFDNSVPEFFFFFLFKRKARNFGLRIIPFIDDSVTVRSVCKVKWNEMSNMTNKCIKQERLCTTNIL